MVNCQRSNIRLSEPRILRARTQYALGGSLLASGREPEPLDAITTRLFTIIITKKCQVEQISN